MPKKTGDFNAICKALRVALIHSAADRQHVVEHYQNPPKNVQRVESGEGVVGRKKCAMRRLITGETADLVFLDSNPVMTGIGDIK